MDESYTITNLDWLEAQSIHIIREVAAVCENPVMLYSIGKDSSVMLHLARKAFDPAPLPFPLMHIDTSFKPKEMIAFRDQLAVEYGFKLLVHTNQEALNRGLDPYRDGSEICTDQLKTQALVRALMDGKYDAAFGGARRDEEKSRAKERVFSFRDQHQQWEPRNQRPELWSLYNAKVRRDESMRVFPLSNWTELDIWHYIRRESIPIVPLYLADNRSVIELDGQFFLDDDRFNPPESASAPAIKHVRFRTLGCVPFTAAVESDATTLDQVIEEVMAARNSERQGRVIDFDEECSMEKKKREGYF